MPGLPSATLPPFPSDVPVADIYEIDFQKLSTGDRDAAQKVLAASQGYGFFYLSNTGIDYQYMFDVAQETFDLPIDEKMKYEMGNQGGYFGYKMSGSNYIDDKGTPDNMEFYNVSKDDCFGIGKYKGEPLQHPETIRRSRGRLEEFMRGCHRVTVMVLRVLGEQLGLGPETLPEMHKLEAESVDQARVTFASPCAADRIAFGEHTDFGSVTVLFNKLGGLQVINPNSKEWKYVKPRPDCAIINLGDAIVKLVGNRLYSAVHRVMGPPGDQAQLPRHSVVYFSRPNSHVRLRSLLDDDMSEEDAMTIDEWIANRVKLRRTPNFKGKETYQASRGTEHTSGGQEALDGNPLHGHAAGDGVEVK